MKTSFNELFKLGKKVYRHKEGLNIVVGDQYEWNDDYGLRDPIKGEYITKKKAAKKKK